jgi:hypothetical protein
VFLREGTWFEGEERRDGGVELSRYVLPSLTSELLLGRRFLDGEPLALLDRGGLLLCALLCGDEWLLLGGDWDIGPERNAGWFAIWEMW